jgi:hypothetical protein
MKKLIFATGVFTVGMILNSCSGNSAETSSASGSPASGTTLSGSTHTVIETETGKEKEFKYTLLQYTPNIATTDLPIQESYAPAAGEQMLELRVEAEVISLGSRSTYGPPSAFSLGLTEGSDLIDCFTRFSEEFEAGLEFRDLAPGEKQEVSAYFIIPADANLSEAYLSIYRGSKKEPVTLKLNN